MPKIAGTLANQVPTFKINDTKLYVSFVTFSAQDNIKLLKLESGFKKQLTEINDSLK